MDGTRSLPDRTWPRPGGDLVHDPLLRGLLDHASALIAVKDVHGRFLLVNPAYARAVGRDPQDLVGRTARDVVPDAVAAAWSEHDRQVVESGVALQFPERFQGAEGKLVECIATKFPLFDDDGAVMAIGSLRVEIGDLEGARDALEDSERRYQELFDQSAVGQVELDLTGHPVAVNATAVELLGFDGPPSPGTPASQLLRVSTGDRLHAQLGEILGGRAGEYRGSHRLHREDGSHRTVLVNASPVRGVDAVVRGALVTLVDTSDQERAETDLRMSERRSRSLLHAMPDAVIVIDSGGVIREANDQTSILFGYRTEELIGRPVEDLVPRQLRQNHVHLRGAYEVQEHAVPMATGRNVRGVRRDGTEVPVEINLSSVVLHDGRAVIATVRDVTKTRRLEERLRLGQQRQRALLQGMPDAVVVVDQAGQVREVNHQAAVLFGYAADELLGRSVDDLVPPEARAEHPVRRSGYVGQADPVPMSTGDGVVALRRDGSRVPVEITLAAVSLDDGPAVIASVRDVTSTRALQQQLHDSEELFRQAFDRAPTGMMLTSLQSENLGRILMVNPTFCALVERPRRELIGADSASILHDEDVPRSRDALEHLSTGGAQHWNSERRLVQPSGREVWVRLSTSVVHAPDGTPLHAITQVEDITARRQAEKDLAHQALHDALTGLPNRALLLDHLSQALARAARHPDSHVAVLYLDLDNFKDVNDALGHAAGDEVLVEFARRLRGHLRDVDTAARLGGDEFVVVCEEVAGSPQAAQVAARIEQALSLDVPVRDQNIHITASIGIALGDGRDSAADLLRAADTAMYRAKRAGRGRYALVDPEAQTRALRRMNLASDLRRALERDDELLLHYQPAFDARTGAVRAVEALLRWRHPEHGLMSPDHFIDIAEERELIVPLGAWVLRAACRQSRRWQDLLAERAPEMWVNISSRQLGTADLTSLVSEVLTESSTSAGDLCLEITERQVVEVDRAVQQDLDGLMRLGCHIAIDDFGTGHNDMSVLRALPFDALKVDRSYVAGLGTDRTDTAITTSVIALSKALGLQVVAEGVETVEQVRRLQELDCDLLQGYLLHRPGPANVIEDVLTVGNPPAALDGPVHPPRTDSLSRRRR